MNRKTKSLSLVIRVGYGWKYWTGHFFFFAQLVIRAHFNVQRHTELRRSYSYSHTPPAFFIRYANTCSSVMSMIVASGIRNILSCAFTRICILCCLLFKKKNSYLTLNDRTRNPAESASESHRQSWHGNRCHRCCLLTSCLTFSTTRDSRSRSNPL